MKELEKAQTEMTELGKAQAMLFMIIRNNIVMPKGIELGKDMNEINRMSYATMIEVYKMIDFDQAFETFRQARQSYSERSRKSEEKAKEKAKASESVGAEVESEAPKDEA